MRDQRTPAGFLAQREFPSLQAALQGLESLTSSAATAGRKPSALLAMIANQNPARVIVKLATRAYWLSLGTKDPVLLREIRQQDEEHDLRVFIEGRAGRFARNTSRMFRGMDAANNQMMRSFGTGALVVGAASVAAGGALSVFAHASNRVEDGLARLATVTTPFGKTMAQALDESKNAALEWSKVHAQSAEQFIDANYNMGSAGLNSTQALEGTRTALLLATATMGDAGTASNLVATLYNNMADKTADAGREMTRLGDVLAKTQALFQIKDLGQLNESLKMGTPAALQFGVSVEQLSNALGFLNTAGLQGSMAGTAFSATMRQMGKAAKALRFDVAKTADGGVDFAATIGNIEKKFGSFAKMTDDQKAKFQQAFGDEGLRGLSLMLGKSEELRGSLAKIGEAAGTMAEQAATIEGTRSKGWEILGNRIEAVRVRLGDALLPVLDRLMPSIGRAIDGVEGWSRANGQWLQGGFADGLATAKIFVDGVADGFGTARKAMEGAIAPLREVSGLFGGTANSAKLLGQAVGIGAPLFILYAGVVKGATFALGLYTTATKAAAFFTGSSAAAAGTASGANAVLTGTTTTATGATWLSVFAEKARTGALALGRVATMRMTFASIASAGAAKGVAFATWGWTGAVQAYTFATSGQLRATVLAKGAAIASRGAEVLLTGARWAARTAVDAYAIARGRATVAEGLGAASAGVANLALAPLLVTLGAVTAAVGALIVAWKSWESLDAAAGGHAWEGVKAAFDFEKGGSMGERFLGKIDDLRNADARAAFAAEQVGEGESPQMVSPEERVSQSMSETFNETKASAELTIKDESGRGKITKQKGKMPIKLEPSGAFG